MDSYSLKTLMRCQRDLDMLKKRNIDDPEKLNEIISRAMPHIQRNSKSNADILKNITTKERKLRVIDNNSCVVLRKLYNLQEKEPKVFTLRSSDNDNIKLTTLIDFMISEKKAEMIE